jgi:tripartite ATP-independent transporter DctM subunit
MAIYIFFKVLRNPALAKVKDDRIPLREKILSLRKLWPTFLLVVVVMFSIYSGICTATEAGAIGAGVALLLAAFYYKTLTWQSFMKIFGNTSRIVGAIMIIVACAFAFGQFLLYTRVPDRLAEFSVSLGLSPILIILFFMLILVFLGCFIDAGSIILVTTPIFLPTVIALGYDPLWYGIILVMNMEMAVITPPVGLNLYTMRSLTDEVTMEEIILGALPYVILEFATLMLFVLIPELVLWLPRLMK